MRLPNRMDRAFKTNIDNYIDNEFSETFREDFYSGKEYKINGTKVKVDNVYFKQIKFLNKPIKQGVFVSLNKLVYSWEPIYEINDFLRNAVPVT